MDMKLTLHLLMIILLVMLSCTWAVSGGSPDIGGKDLPSELADNLTRSISDSLHAFGFDDETKECYAWNPGQDIAIRVKDDSSVLFTHVNESFGMTLAGLGRGGTLQLAGDGEVVPSGRKVEIARPGSVEWYINRDEGIEQGMTIATPPEGIGPLRVTFDSSGDLVPVLEGQNLVFSGQEGPVISYGGLKAYDAAGNSLPARMLLSGTRISWDVDDRDAVYPVTIDPIVSQVKILAASDQADGDYFGNSVAVSGDTAVVGAYSAASGGSDRGQAYIFYRDEGGPENWGEVKILTAPVKADNDQFGRSVAIFGDIVVVGAPGADSGVPNCGKAYIFSRDVYGLDYWGLMKILTAADAGESDAFGTSVGISGDTVVIGAPFAAFGEINCGKAYIFSRNWGGTDSWGQEKVLTASDKAYFDYFGCSVAISGDTVLVGAPWADSWFTDCGKAYVFSRDQGGPYNWGEMKILNASDRADNAEFGCSVAISVDTVVIGAFSADSGGTDRGQAYVFSKDQGGVNNWGQVKILTALDQANGDIFGCSVGISGDNVVIGAEGADSGGTDRGQAYIFSKDQGGADNWGQVKILTASDRANSDHFGCLVAITADAAIVGAVYADSGGTNRGQAYVFGPALPDHIAVYNAGNWYIDNSGDGQFNSDLGDQSCTFGSPGWIQVIGDWNGDGCSEIGVYQSGAWILDYDGSGGWSTGDKNYAFGGPGWTPVVGYWRLGKTTKIGIYKDGAWLLDYDGSGAWLSIRDKNYGFGDIGWTPVIGDWNGDVGSEIGIYKDGAWLLDFDGSGGWNSGDGNIGFGDIGWTPVIGDWNGNGRTEIGIYKDGAWLLDYDGSGGWSAGDKNIGFGDVGWTPVVGDWNGDGNIDIGIYQNGAWLLDYDGSGGWSAGDKNYGFGGPGWTPVTGNWVETS